MNTGDICLRICVLDCISFGNPQGDKNGVGALWHFVMTDATCNNDFGIL